MTDDQPETAFRLSDVLVDGFAAGSLSPAEENALAEEIARLLPFHAQLPHPVAAALKRVEDRLGGASGLWSWLDRHPGRPRETARLYQFMALLDRISPDPAVVAALTELRAETPYPPGLEEYLLPITSEETLANLSGEIELLLAKDRVDDALRLARATADVLARLAPRVAEREPQLRGLSDEVTGALRELAGATTS
jgi:hypothetical protein